MKRLYQSIRTVAYIIQDKAFKKDIQFAEGPKTKKLYYIRIKYRLDNDTCLQTFYLDDQLTRVVSFRNH